MKNLHTSILQNFQTYILYLPFWCWYHYALSTITIKRYPLDPDNSNFQEPYHTVSWIKLSCIHHPHSFPASFYIFLNSTIYIISWHHIYLSSSPIECKLNEVINYNFLDNCCPQSLKQSLTYSRFAYTYWMNDSLPREKKFSIKLTLCLGHQSV